MAVGAAYLARRKAIVQKLTAIESLAVSMPVKPLEFIKADQKSFKGVDILCSDKTGTLTANKLSIRNPYVAKGLM